MRTSLLALLGLAVCAAASWASSFQAAQDYVARLESAASPIPEGTHESLVSQASQWPDGSPSARTGNLFVQRLNPYGGSKAALGPVSLSKPVRAKTTVPSPAAEELDDSPSEDGLYSKLTQGFLEVMSPAIGLLTKGTLGKIAGSLLALALLVPALIVGGIRGMF